MDKRTIRKAEIKTTVITKSTRNGKRQHKSRDQDEPEYVAGIHSNSRIYGKLSHDAKF
jgi:hypothetical protein